MTKTYNFSNPMYGRKWLRLLRDDPVSGIRILPNLDLPSRDLGFSFRSNALGLRGPADVHAPNVVLGTSFAMGFAVDNGWNWHEKCLDGSWINLGLPIGARQMESLFNAIYQGPARTALVLYHPNLWMQTRVFELCRVRGGPIMKAMGWQTDFWPCVKLALRRLRWRRHNLRKGELLVFRQGGRKYEMDALYSKVNFLADPEVVSLVLDTMGRILARFERVIVIRTLIKQEMVPVKFRNDLLRSSLCNYDEGWELFQNQLGSHPRIEFHVTEGFTLEDFFPQDNHWTPEGNEKFARQVQRLLQG
jgi:hypothetical protein